MLSYKNRFHGHGSLRYVQRNGSVRRSLEMQLRYLENPRRKDSRFAVVVSKKVAKSAVTRNRIRRRVYEIIRTELLAAGGVYDIVLSINSDKAAIIDSEILRTSILALFNTAGIYKNKP
ncbi:ribonuclease P protein component [Candidatus Saccharibacteria bacterium]|nr:ribonuclease P protein component [Candidatus Saccharibacteria bacterium]